MIAVESLLLLLGGIAVAAVLILAFGRGGGVGPRGGHGAASVRLVRILAGGLAQGDTESAPCFCTK